MAWELSDAIKLGSVFAAISTAFALQRSKIKILFTKTNRHDKIFHGDGSKEGGLLTDVQLTKQKVEEIDKKMDDTKSDVTWIRNHLSNSGKK